MKNRYLAAGIKPWNQRHLMELVGCRAGEDWRLIGAAEDLDLTGIGDYDPRMIFFLHWSHKVPAELLDRYECVCFHMTDVPYGRGGSPLQNLIARGHRETMLTALRMVEQFDAGPVYLKRALSLEGGTAEEIYMRASALSCEMIGEILDSAPVPQPQKGNPTVFRRRKPAESALSPDLASLGEAHDLIRMLDAEGYPKAYLEVGRLRIEFSRSALYHDRIVADATITTNPEKD